jgi:hypothetical protein
MHLALIKTLKKLQNSLLEHVRKRKVYKELMGSFKQTFQGLEQFSNFLSFK